MDRTTRIKESFRHDIEGPETCLYTDFTPNTAREHSTSPPSPAKTEVKHIPLYLRKIAGKHEKSVERVFYDNFGNP